MNITQAKQEAIAMNTLDVSQIARATQGDTLTVESEELTEAYFDYIPDNVTILALQNVILHPRSIVALRESKVEYYAPINFCSN